MTNMTLETRLNKFKKDYALFKGLYLDDFKIDLGNSRAVKSLILAAGIFTPLNCILHEPSAA
mgnify:CR=1 FL=1